MKRRRFVIIGALVALLTGCTATAAPEPQPSTGSPTLEVSASPTPTPTGELMPQSVFDISCEQISGTISAFAGSPVDAVEQTLGLFSGPDWYPGPAQLMAPRAGGLACSFDGELAEDGSRPGWRVMIVPGAQSIVDALASAGYPEAMTECTERGCRLFARNGDALLTGEIVANGFAPAETEEVSALAQSWVDQAAASQQPDFTVAPSRLAGAECTELLRPEQISSLWGVEAELSDEFGGWSVPTEVYTVVNGGTHCSYTSNAGSYEAEQYLFITDLPAGSWALPHKDGQKKITISGADAAWTGTDEMREGRPFIDLDIDGDWVRLTGYSYAPERDLAAVAGVVAENVAAWD